MAEDTKVLQDMADSMLPLFNNMPQVLVVVEDDEVFFKRALPVSCLSCSEYYYSILVMRVRVTTATCRRRFATN